MSSSLTKNRMPVIFPIICKNLVKQRTIILWNRRGLKSKVAASPPIVTKTKSSSKEDRKNRLLKSKELISYITKKADSLAPTIQKVLSPKYFKINTSVPTTTYLIDKSVASRIASVIKKEKLDLNAPVLELSPGVGILTSELIQLGFKNITCLEEQAKAVKYLQEEFPEVHFVQKGYSDLPRLHHVDKVDGGSRVSNVLSQIKSTFKDKPAKKKNLYVFGSFPHLSLINFTIKSLISQRILYEEDWEWEDPIYYIVLGPKAYWILNSTPTSGYFMYRPSAVLFQNLFKSTLLETLPRQAYIPWVNQNQEGKSKKFKLRNAFEADTNYLLKLETNTDVVNKLGRDQLLPFWYFVRQHLFSRRKPIIPQLEQWIPGCGARLIRQGFDIYTPFGSLNPQQVFELYLNFISWPEFPGSSFLAAVEKYQSRLETQDEDVIEYQKRQGN